MQYKKGKQFGFWKKNKQLMRKFMKPFMNCIEIIYWKDCKTGDSWADYL